jgi:predicted component of type VI protein secretion system
VDYLNSLLCAWLALTLLVTGCASPRPLKGGRALTTHKPAGSIEQTLVQSENPAQATKQDQETVKVRTYTLPAGSRLEQSQPPTAAPAQLSTINSQPINLQPSTLSLQPSTSFLLSGPMPVVEREETRARTELGAAQKDTARELGARLSSLKGIVWVGVGLFVFGLASLVWPPLKAVIASVTTSAALMLGGVALMVLPSLVVGNELLILGSVGLAVGGWFLAHRHGQLRGIVATSTAAQTSAPPSGTAPASTAAPVSPKCHS